MMTMGIPVYMWMIIACLHSLFDIYIATQADFYFKTTPGGTALSDDIVLVDRDCNEFDISDCPDPDPNAFIRPRITFRPTPGPTILTSTLDGGYPDEPCDPDDDDCLTGSGSGFIVEAAISTPSNTGDTSHDPDQDKDIDIDQDKDKDKEVPPPGSPSPDTPIIIDVNMTETPLQTDHPLITSTLTPHSGLEDGATDGDLDTGGEGDLEPFLKGNTTLGMNIGLIVGIALGVVLLLLIIAFALYKYKNRDEGSYKMDESKNYSYETCNTKPPSPQTNGAMSKPGPNCSKSPKVVKKREVKEWYV